MNYSDLLTTYETLFSSHTHTHQIKVKVSKHLSQNKILHDSQHGFRSRRSCETQLFIRYQDLARSLADGNQIDIILLDFSMIHKLNYDDIRDKNLNWIADFLENRHLPNYQLTLYSNSVQFWVQPYFYHLLMYTVNVRLFADNSFLYRNVNNQIWFRIVTQRFDKPGELVKDLADEI